MKRKLQQVNENGKMAWRIVDDEIKIGCKCDKMRKAAVKAARVYAEMQNAKEEEGEKET